MLTGAAAAFDVQVVDTTAALEALVPEWRRLAARSRTSTVFQEPEWLVTWWAHFGNGRLRTLVLRQGEQLVGLVPVFDAAEPPMASGVLRFVGDGITDHLDGIFDPDRETAAADAALQYIGSRGEVQLVALEELPAGSPLLHARTPAGWTGVVQPTSVCPVLSLPGPGAAGPAAVPLDQRQRLAYYRRRAARVGPVTIRAAEPDTLGRDLDTLFHLHALRWQQRGTRGVLAERRVQAFHHALAERLRARGMLRLWILEVGGHVGAALYGFVHRRRFAYYISGFDPAFRALSPGLLLVGHALETAQRDGCTAFDFLRGAEAYKYAWGAADVPGFRRVLRAAPGAEPAAGPDAGSRER